MRSAVLATFMTAAFAMRGRGSGEWWGGAPECAHSCLSSVYSEAATLTTWPEPGAFCTGTNRDPISSCLSSSCTATPTAYSSWSSMHSSLCSLVADCQTATDSVYTITRPTPTGTGIYAGGPWRTNTDSVVTVTGCPTFGPNFGAGYGPYGGGGRMPWGNHNPDDAYWGWGKGWCCMSTSLETVTTTVTADDGSESLSTGVVTVAQAVTEDETTTTTFSDGMLQLSTGTGIGAGGTADCTNDGDCTATGTGLGAEETGDGDSGANGGGVEVMGAALAAVVAVAGML